MRRDRSLLPLAVAAVVCVSTVTGAGRSASAVEVPRTAGGSGTAEPTGAGSATPWSPRPATYDTVTEHDVAVTMSDGVVLRADVVRPAHGSTPAPGRFPVIVEQTPYNKANSAIAAPATYLVRRGYVEVVVDVRGTGGSQGTWDSFGSREQRDGKEIVEWAASPSRPWSDGRVGLYGASYSAINQLFTAAQQPKGLRAAFPIVPAADVYRDVVASGGQVDSGFIPLWLGLVTATGVLPPTSAAADPVMAAGAMAAHLGGAGAFQLPVLMSALTGDQLAFDGPFYRLRSPIEVLDRVKVPTFVVGGWYDIFQRGEPLVYERLRRNGVPTRLLMGPWEHTTVATQAAPPHLPAPGVPDLDAAALRWFDRYVRGRSDPALDHDVAPVTYWRLGSGGWATAPSWMPASVQARTLQLSGAADGVTAGRLVRGAGTGHPDTIEPVLVSGLCSRSSSQWTGGLVPETPCASDHRLDDATGLSYDVRLTAPLRLYGPVALRTFVSTTGGDGMLAARLEDVAPDGTVTQLTGGWQVLSLRRLDRSRSRLVDANVIQPYHPFTKASVEPVMAGAVNEVYVELFPTGAQLPAGHTLRVSLHAFDTPHLVAPVPELAASVGVLSVYHDAAHPSQVILPVQP